MNSRLAGFALSLGVVFSCGQALAEGHEIIKTDEAPQAIGPYSQAIKAQDMLFVSGQIALDPKTGVLGPDNITDQTHQVLANLKSILKAADMGFEDVVSVQVYLTDLNDFAQMNTLYAEAFVSLPARATVQVAKLPKGARLEISLIAMKSKSKAHKMAHRRHSH